MTKDKDIKDNKRSSDRYLFPMDTGTKLNGIRETIFLDRYSMKDEKGNSVEKYPEQMWKRVSRAVSQSEKSEREKKVWEERFYEIMTGFKFSPAGRFLTSAGTGTDTTMINCYVIPSPEDTRHGIIKTLEYVTEISARGGGIGFNLSSLRPRGSYLKAVNGTTSGAVSWAELYSISVHDIIQQGGTRRGALMMMLWDWHPDIEEFVKAKKENGKLVGANLSVAVSDKFMELVENDGDWELKFPETSYEKYKGEWNGDLKEWEGKGYPVRTYKTIKARQLWNLICESAWVSAEPGIVFLDRYNNMNNTWYFERVVSTNPCGEQGLPAWGVCNLGSLNLSAFVKDEKFNFDEFKEAVTVAVRFLDDAIDAEKYLYEEIEEVQMRERRQGLGTMGLADALIKMKVRYGSEESLEVIDEIYRTLRDTAYLTSISLAKEKGAFPKFDKDKYLRGGFIKTLPEEIKKEIKKHGIRNALVLTEAPTGKISLLAGVNSGIEPVFSFSYIQKDRLGERTMYHPLYQEWVDLHGRKDIPSYFVVADDLVPEEHVAVQALIQKYTDSSISKTVNAPETHTVGDVKKLYELAYKTGCKGISYMREGSREGTLVRATVKEEKKEPEPSEENWERPVKITGSTYKLKTPVGTAFITVNQNGFGYPVEVFINIGRAGSDIQAMAEALGRIISKTLKSSSRLTGRERAFMIVEQLQGIGGARSVGFGSNKISSLPDAVAKAIAMDMGLTTNHEEKPVNGFANGEVKKQKLNLTENQQEVPVQKSLFLEARQGDICPECGFATLVYEMGCTTCHSCGHSEC